jgi:hypothetical protein
MGLLDNSMRNVTNMLTQKFGTTIMLREVREGALDLATDTVPTQVIDYTVPATVREYTLREVAASDLQQGDLRVEVPALALEQEADDPAIRPDPSWRVVWMGTEMPIVGDIGINYVGDKPASYVMTARGA